MAQLSGERIRSELLLLLAAPGAVAALRSMRDIGIIAPLLGVDGNVEPVERLAAIERHLSRAPDPVLRLAALAAGTSENLRERLQLSGHEAERLAAAAALLARASTRAATRAPPRITSTGTAPRRSPTPR